MLFLITVAICDNDDVTRGQLCSMSGIILKKMSVEFGLLEFGGGERFTEYLTSGGAIPNIVSLSMELCDADSITFSNYLNERYPDMQIILVAADIANARLICNTKFSSFLVKPVTYDNFEAVFLNCIPRAAAQKNKYITVSSEWKLVTLNTNEIKYCESYRHLLTFRTVGGECRTYVKISDVEGKLPSNFVRTHKSYIVNFDYVSAIFPYAMQISDGTVLPIPQKKYREIKEKYMAYADGKR